MSSFFQKHGSLQFSPQPAGPAAYLPDDDDDDWPPPEAEDSDWPPPEVNDNADDA